MLIKVTNHCAMGCSHCLENSTVRGTHMGRALFQKAIEFCARIEGLAWAQGYTAILLSGGECTDNPELPDLIQDVFDFGLLPIVLSHGLWLNDPVLRSKLLREDWPELRFQITNDPRFYPKAPPRVDDPRIGYVDSLTVMTQQGRFKDKTHPEVPLRRGPSSFNIRSLTRSYGDVRLALAHMRALALTGRSGHCSPSISADGTLVAGESNECFPIGNVDSTPEEITKALIRMKCDRCHRAGDLTQEQRRAIGESSLYLAGE